MWKNQLGVDTIWKNQLDVDELWKKPAWRRVDSLDIPAVGSNINFEAWVEFAHFCLRNPLLQICFLAREQLHGFAAVVRLQKCEHVTARCHAAGRFTILYNRP
uniref:Uncharacterized protein n=1 Tax=Peronospora matthiolae TaxID=2874970 RepID=A0AAV1TIA7_9STRA